MDPDLPPRSPQGSSRKRWSDRTLGRLIAGNSGASASAVDSAAVQMSIDAPVGFVVTSGFPHHHKQQLDIFNFMKGFA